MRLALVVAILAASSAALAQPATVPAQPTDKVSADHGLADEPLAVGLAVNAPLRWAGGDSVGVSGYIAFAQQHALRLNFATYAHHASTLGLVAAIALGEDGDEAGHSGRITDLGIGYQHYSRGLFEGFTVEAGLLRRARDTRWHGVGGPPAIVETAATGYGARALVGWSWLWARRAFFAVGAGVSVGRYSGSERTAPDDYMPVYTTKDFVRYEIVPEGYMRIGLAFGL